MTSTAEKLAVKFHEEYERLAPEHGYETRKDTQIFDPDSPNGRLMIAVCAHIIGESEATSRRFFSAGFSQGYGAQPDDINRVDELFDRTQSFINDDI